MNTTILLIIDLILISIYEYLRSLYYKKFEKKNAIIAAIIGISLIFYNLNFINYNEIFTYILLGFGIYFFKTAPKIQ